MFKLRFGLELYAGVRPIKMYPGVPGALRRPENIDFVVLRENTEGLYVSVAGGLCLNDEVAVDNQIITRRGSERIHKYAFELALTRKGRLLDGKSMVSCAHKGNNLVSLAFFKQIFEETAEHYRNHVDAETTMIDAIAMLMTLHPENYDVIVAENSHGDILSDLAAAYIGGLGMAPSGDIGDNLAMFQPSHGTAPSIARKNIVNPTATILSGKMMFEWLGQEHDDAALLAAAGMIDAALTETFLAGMRTSDIGGNASTTSFTDEVIKRLGTIKI
jgi:3-isopropylmalate dehydrogenase